MAKADRKSLVEDAYQRLKADILSNRMQAGTQMTEPEIASLLDMSRTPVREALTRLEADGLIELIPRHGARIRPVSAQDMREIYEILTALEPQAAYSVAQAGLNHAQLATLEQATIDMETALEQEDLDLWAEADHRFHEELLRLHGNLRLRAMVAVLSDQAHRVRMLTVRERKVPVRSTFEHRAIFDAIARGDADNARASYTSHRERSAEEILKILQRIPNDSA